jgi:hypothetical protein
MKEANGCATATGLGTERFEADRSISALKIGFDRRFASGENGENGSISKGMTVIDGGVERFE